MLKSADVSIQLHLARPTKHRGGSVVEEEEGPVKEITNYYRRRFIEKNWFVLGIAEGDPYRGSLEAPHSGPSLRRIEVYELSMPWFQRRETLQFLPGFVSVRTNTTVSSRWKLILTTNISYFSFEKFPLARI